MFSTNARAPKMGQRTVSVCWDCPGGTRRLSKPPLVLLGIPHGQRSPHNQPTSKCRTCPQLLGSNICWRLVTSSLQCLVTCPQGFDPFLPSTTPWYLTKRIHSSSPLIPTPSWVLGLRPSNLPALLATPGCSGGFRDGPQRSEDVRGARNSSGGTKGLPHWKWSSVRLVSAAGL